ncbi:MAG: glycosyl transferase family 1 [Sphingobium sp. 66-54]|nr:MAG: glycosyl transferase family 1 [Sphingobium sp. 66-54]
MNADAGQPILLDVSRLIWRAWAGMLPTGIDRTALAYLAHFRSRARAVVQRGGRTRILSSKLSQRLFDILLDGGPAARAGLCRLVLPGLIASEQVVPGSIYLNVGHTGLDRKGHVLWLQRVQARAVYFVHDLIPLTHPEYCRTGEPAKHRRRIEAMLGHGVGIIGNSRDTLDELTAFAALQGGRFMLPSLVAPLGIGAPTAVHDAELPLTGSYFVMLGTLEGRKNHLLALNVWADLARRLGAACPQLVIIGRRGWECEQAVDMLERCEAIRDHVIELPRCNDEMLAAYMRGARALLFPSFVEGYGLPLIEALACGIPVIASGLAVFRELAGDIPDYLSPIDGLGWLRAIEDYAQDGSARRNAQLARMIDWAPPTWTEHFARVDAFLEDLSRKPE